MILLSCPNVKTEPQSDIGRNRGKKSISRTAVKERSNGMRTDRIHSKTTLHGNHVSLCLLPGKG